jgi:hypothetical protein
MSTLNDIYQNLMSYLSIESNVSSAYTILANGMVDFDPCLVHTNLVVHASTIMLYQLIIDFNAGAPQLALSRCNEAVDGIIATVRGISDADAELNSPLFSSFLYVAARYKLNVYRSLDQPKESSFDTLMHGISMCGRRWEIARRLDIVLRAAIHELDHRSDPDVMASGTHETEVNGFSKFESLEETGFWDMKKSHLDTSEALKAWVGRQGSRGLFIGGLNGPYF